MRMAGIIPLLLLLLISGISAAQTVCVLDPGGQGGELMQEMRGFTLAARSQGVTLQLRAYTDERVASEDFKAGQCQAVLFTGIRARQFNAFTGSIDSIGGLPDYEDMLRLLDTLSQPKAAPLMRQGAYETAGLLPLGAAYLFIRDRKIDSVAKMAGKRLATLEHDRAQLRMAQRIGAQAIPCDITNFAGKFNNGVVDVAVAPAIAYEPLELYKGVGTRGVVLNMPVAQLTLQFMLRHADFPPAFGQFSRQYFHSRSPAILQRIRDAEQKILFFFPPPDGEGPGYQALLREARIALTKEGFYDKRMMALLKKVRCKRQPDAAECTDKRE